MRTGHMVQHMLHPPLPWSAAWPMLKLLLSDTNLLEDTLTTMSWLFDKWVGFC